MQNKQLTISIPIYNGAKTIRKLLNSIFDNPENLNLCKVLIVDNASTDKTSEIVNEFVRKFNNVRYIVNDSNIGPDANFKKCVAEADTNYVWIIGDDDYITHDAISKVVTYLNSDYSAIVINYSVIQKDGKKVERIVRQSKNIEFMCIGDVVKSIGLPMNFLSCVIHKRDDFLSVDCSELLQSYWIQLGIYIEETLEKKSLFIAEPLVINAGNSLDSGVNTNGNAVHVIKQFYIVVNRYKEYFLNSYVYFLDYAFIHLIRKIFIGKRTGYILNYEDFVFFLLLYIRFPFKFFTIFIALITPCFLYKLLYKLIKITNLRGLVFRLFIK